VIWLEQTGSYAVLTEHKGAAQRRPAYQRTVVNTERHSVQKGHTLAAASLAVSASTCGAFFACLAAMAIAWSSCFMALANSSCCVHAIHMLSKADEPLQLRSWMYIGRMMGAVRI
jgi:hypothetical protein